MRYCKGCGLPVPYGKFLEWTSDGTIIGKDSAHTRLVYLKVEDIRNMFKGITQRVGVSVDQYVAQAEKEVGKRFAKALVPGFVAHAPRGRIARPEIGVKAASHFIFNYMGGLGMGCAEMLEYRSGQGARILIENSHYIPLVVGDGAGVFEFLERIPVTARWEPVGPDSYVVYVEKTEQPQQQELAQELALEKEANIPGEVHFERCPKCKIPFLVSRSLYLDLDKGSLRNTVTGDREVALPVESFHAVATVMTTHFGAELPYLMEKLEQKHVRESSGVRYYADASGDKGMLGIFSDFTWRGVGNPVWAGNTERGVEVVVDNPFHPGMVAGRVAGQYEAWTDSLVRSSWTEEAPGRLRVLMEPVA